METLLPPNSTAAERALATVAARISDVPVPVGDLWSPERCPPALLPWLAWALSVDEWDPLWTDERKRASIAAAVMIHRHKGTLWSMKRALAVAGLGDAEITEQYSAWNYDGSFLADGSRNHVSSDHWAEYRVTLMRPMSIRQAEYARAILQASAPARCHLKVMDHTTANNLYDGAIGFDGAYSHGVV